MPFHHAKRRLDCGKPIREGHGRSSAPRPTPRRLKKYVSQCLRLKAYLRSPGDGRGEGRMATLPYALDYGVNLKTAPQPEAPPNVSVP